MFFFWSLGHKKEAAFHSDESRHQELFIAPSLAPIGVLQRELWLLTWRQHFAKIKKKSFCGQLILCQRTGGEDGGRDDHFTIDWTKSTRFSQKSGLKYIPHLNS